MFIKIKHLKKLFSILLLSSIAVFPLLSLTACSKKPQTVSPSETIEPTLTPSETVIPSPTVEPTQTIEPTPIPTPTPKDISFHVSCTLPNLDVVPTFLYRFVTYQITVSCNYRILFDDLSVSIVGADYKLYNRFENYPGSSFLMYEYFFKIKNATEFLSIFVNYKDTLLQSYSFPVVINELGSHLMSMVQNGADRFEDTLLNDYDEYLSFCYEHSIKQLKMERDYFDNNSLILIHQYRPIDCLDCKYNTSYIIDDTIYTQYEGKLDNATEFAYKGKFVFWVQIPKMEDVKVLKNWYYTIVRGEF